MPNYYDLKIYIKKLFYRFPFIWKVLEFFQGLLYVYQYVYYYKLPGHRNRFSVKEFNIEFASQCNLRCAFCSLDHLKPKQTITTEILDTFFETLRTDKRFRSINIVRLHNGGEALLHPKRLEMLAVIKKHKDLAKASNQKFPKIDLLTNGMLLGERLAKQIIELDVLDSIGLSMDGGTPEAFEKMRTNAKWPRFYKNLTTFCELNRAAGHHIQTYTICCIPDDKPLNTKWMDAEFRTALETLDRAEIRYLHNWAGEVDTVKVKDKPHKIGCSLLMTQMILLPNGDITVCCNDLNSKGVVGNILQDDIFEIYKSQNRRVYIDKLLVGKKEELELCSGCETF